MKKLFFILCFTAGLMSLNAQTLSQSFLFDFGPVTGANGEITTGADANGKYWNNIANGTGGASVAAGVAFTALVNSANIVSTYALTTTVAGFTPNGLLNGALRTPYASQFTSGSSDADLAIATGTEDYWYTTSTTSPAFKITGLNPVKRYKFKIFGSRTGDLLRTSKYTIVGATSTNGNLNTSNTIASASYGTVYSLTTGYNVNSNNGYQLTSGGSYTLSTVYTGNNCNSYVTDYLNPLNVSGLGEFTLTLSSANAQNAYINCMKMEEYKGTQTITFGALTNKAIGDADYAPSATASSGLAVRFESSNTSVASIVDGKIHIIGVGNTTITAFQDGDATYEAATSVPQTLSVSASLTAQTITFNALSAKTTGDAPFDLSATASSNLTVTYTSSNPAVAAVLGNTVTIVGGGTTDITASQSGNSTYAAASNVIQTLTVNKQNQTITFGALSSKTDADASFSVSQSSTSGLPVTLTSSNTAVALVSGSKITIVGAGTSTITASQAGNTIYNAATSVPQTLTVSSVMAANQNLLFDFGPRDVTNGDETTNPDANGNYWNNISNAAGGTGWSTTYPAFTNLFNTSNTNTGFTMAFTANGFTANGKLNGGLLTPHASQFGSNSELAISTATQDYIFTGNTTNGPVIKFSGLNTAKKYRFKIFGSRNSNLDRAAQYTLQGAGAPSVGALQSSTVAGLGGTVYIGLNVNYPTNLNVLYAITPTDTLTKAVTYYGNNSSVYTSGLVQPDETGAITLTTITTTPSSAFAYINCLKIEEYADSRITDKFRPIVDKIKVYPTSFSNQISVEGALSLIEIYNALGVTVRKQKATAMTVINTSQLANGIYVLVVDGNKSYKLIK